LTASQVQEQPPSRWAVALQQVRDPANISLSAVAVARAAGLLVTSSAILRAQQEVRRRVKRRRGSCLSPAPDAVPKAIVNVDKEPLWSRIRTRRLTTD
jgi:hypothetical protein